MARRIVLALLLFVAVFVFIGCQTINGIGRDIQWFGEKTSEAASPHTP